MTKFWDTVAEDLCVARVIRSEARPKRHALIYWIIWCSFFKPSVMCVFWYRVNRVLYERGFRSWASYLNARRRYRFGNDISYKACIGPGLYLPHFSDIVIGPRVVIGRRATILNGVTIGVALLESETSPIVGDYVLVGTGAKVLGGVHVGDCSTVSALSLCTQNVPPDSIFFGIPPNQKIWSGKPE